jgi:hypothetical protein
MQPSSNGYKIEAPTDFLATIGKEFKIASPVKGLNITGDVSIGAGGVFGAPLFQPASSGTVNLRGFHIDLGDPYYPVGVAGAAISRIDATYNKHFTLFVATIINHIQTFDQSTSRGTQKSSGYGSVAISAGIGFNLGGGSR